MDLTFTAEQDAFRAEARAWLAAHVPKRAARLDGHGARASRSTAPGRRTLHDGGYAMVSWPVEYGGRGATCIEWLIFEEEYWRAGAPGRVNQNGIFLLGPTLMEFGTPEQKARYLPRMARSEEVWAQGWSEPNAGSDMAAIRAARRARRRPLRAERPEDLVLARARSPTGSSVSFRTDPTSRAPQGPELHPGAARHARRARAADPAARRRDRLRRGLLRRRPRPARESASATERQGWKIAMATAGFERGLMLRSPARFQATARRLRRALRAHAAAAADRRSRDAVVRALDGRRGLLARHVRAPRRASSPAARSAPRRASTRSSGPRWTSACTRPRCALLGTDAELCRRRPPRRTAAAGSTASSSRSPGRSTPAPTRSSATSSPSASSACRATDACVSRSTRSSSASATSVRGIARARLSRRPPCARSGRREHGARRQRWTALAELGVLGVLVPEHAGGLGTRRDVAWSCRSRKPAAPRCRSRSSRRPRSRAPLLADAREPRAGRRAGSRAIADRRRGRHGRAPRRTRGVADARRRRPAAARARRRGARGAARRASGASACRIDRRAAPLSA